MHHQLPVYVVLPQVGFHDEKLVRTVHVPKKINEIINRLNRTKREAQPDLEAEQEVGSVRAMLTADPVALAAGNARAFWSLNWGVSIAWPLVLTCCVG